MSNYYFYKVVRMMELPDAEEIVHIDPRASFADLMAIAVAMNLDMASDAAIRDNVHFGPLSDHGWDNVSLCGNHMLVVHRTEARGRATMD